MSTVTAKQLHQETKAILNQLESGETLIVTRNGRRIGKMEPLVKDEPCQDWGDVMGEVWRAQKGIQAADRVPNPVLRERQRRRR